MDSLEWIKYFRSSVSRRAPYRPQSTLMFFDDLSGPPYFQRKKKEKDFKSLLTEKYCPKLCSYCFSNFKLGLNLLYLHHCKWWMFILGDKFRYFKFLQMQQNCNRSICMFGSILMQQIQLHLKSCDITVKGVEVRLICR